MVPVGVFSVGASGGTWSVTTVKARAVLQVPIPYWFLPLTSQ